MRALRWTLVTLSAVISVVTISFAFTLVVAHTKLGHPYKVNAQHAHQLIGFVNDLENTYGPIHHIGCYSRWGHIRYSLHHSGNACDIEQTGWSRTSYRPMYHVGWLARKWGLRDGCSFRDCGHVDSGSFTDQAPAGLVASAEIPYSGEAGGSHGYSLAAVEEKPKLKVMKVAKRTKRQAVRVATLWERSDAGDHCVNLGGRLACFSKRVVPL